MLESLLSTYGYPIIVIGTFLEGETVLILGGVSAKLGYLSLKWIIVCGFCGTLVGDQLYFMLGRRHGKTLLAQRPAWESRANRVLIMLEKHQNLLILRFRFLYGLRSVTPFAIGMSQISYARFALLNIIGAGVWAMVIGFAGYYFGHAVDAVLGDIKKYEIELMMLIIGCGLLVWLLYFVRKKRNPGRPYIH